MQSTSIRPSGVVELKAPNQLHIKPLDLDHDYLAPMEVYAQTIYSAISPGTELAAYEGTPPLRPGRAYPRVVGYCNVAQVKQVGDAVCDCSPGDYILTQQSHCTAFICSASQVVLKIPPSADLSEVSKIYLFHLGYNALLKGGFRPGDQVAVIGMGTLGWGAATLASLFGAKVFLFTDQAHLEQPAQAIGAHLVSKNNADRLKHQAIETPHTDLVVTTSNSWEDWTLALQIVRRGGTIAVLGFPGRGLPAPESNPLDSQYFYDKQLTLVACGYSPNAPDASPIDIRFTLQRNCRYLLDLILEGKLDSKMIRSSTLPWQSIEEGYKQLLDHTTDNNTFVLDWCSHDKP